MKSISILKHNLMRATMTLALIVTCATAWAANGNWSSNRAASFSSANGTTINITSPAELALLAYNVTYYGVDYSNYTINLTTDLDMSAHYWDKPIGIYDEYQDKAFRGTFDGGNHTISGIYINGSSDYQGLFGFVGTSYMMDDPEDPSQPGTVRNLTLASSNIYGKENVGGIAGHLRNGTISNCHVLPSVNIYTGSNNSQNHGGIVGHTYTTDANTTSATIQNCTCGASITSGSYSGCSNYGGIIGYSNRSSSTITGCFYYGTSISANSNKGAIVGNCASTSGIGNCYYYYPSSINGIGYGGSVGSVKQVYQLTLGTSDLTISSSPTYTFNGTNYYATATVTTTSNTQIIESLTASSGSINNISYSNNRHSASFNLGSDATVTATFQAISGTTSDGLTWSLGGTNYTELTIGGNGAMQNYGHTTVDDLWRTDAPWGYNITSVTIGNDVTSIGNYAFVGCQSLGTVTLGSGITSIGNYAFDHCDPMTQITLPASVTTLGNNVFAQCGNLERVNFMHDGAITLGNSGIFTNCNNLQYLVFPSPAGALANTTGNWSGFTSKLRAIFGSQLFAVTNEGGTPAYKIASEQDLRNLSTTVNAGNDGSGKTFRQTADITMSNTNFTPIGKGNNGNWFSGTYDGGNHAISNLHVSMTDHYQAALFSFVDSGIVKNIYLDSPNISCTYQNGAIYGTVAGIVNSIKGSTVDHCYVINPTLSASPQAWKVGAIVYSNNGLSSVSNCYFYDINTSHNYQPINFTNNSTFSNVGRAYTLTLGEDVTTTSATVAFSYNVTNYYTGTITLAELPTPAGWVYTYTVNGEAIEGNTFTISADATVARTATPIPTDFEQTATNEYTIHTATGWDVFCDLLQNNSKGYFTNKTVKLGASIGTAENPITRMAGGSYHDFTGTFNGQGNTLTFTYSATEAYAAPFRYVEGSENAHAAIQNLNVISTVSGTNCRHLSGLIGLSGSYVDVSNCNVEVNITSNKGNDDNEMYPSGIVSQCTDTGMNISGCTVTGNIATNGKYAAGLLGVAQGSANITNCVSSVTINSSTAGDGTHGGLVGVVYSGTTAIEGCLFNGKLLTVNTTDETVTGNCGGFVGWRQSTLTISNSLYAPATPTGDEHEVVAGTGDYPSCTFARHWTSSPSNSFFTRTLNTVQGKQQRSVTAGSNVTIEAIALTGNTTTYNVSGITAYSNGGLSLGNTLYYGNQDQVSLTLSNTPPAGYGFNGYTTTGGTLTGTENPYTLTMPNADVEIGAEFISLAVTYLDANGVQQQCTDYTLLTGTITNTGFAAGWYVAEGNVSFNNTIQVNGDAHLILKDGAVVHVGTEENPISTYGILANGHSLSIYAQSTGDNKGQLHVYSSQYGITAGGASVNINGGEVTATGTLHGIYAGDNGEVTINGGEVTATGNGNNGNGIYTSSSGAVTINGGHVTATGAQTGIYADQGTVTISGGEVTATGTTNYGIYVKNNSVTISGGEVTTTGEVCGIRTNNGPVTINGGHVTANGVYGFYVENNSVNIGGGQVSATGSVVGIRVDVGSLSLGWTNASDSIYASSYMGTVNIAEGKAFTSDGTYIYSGTYTGDGVSVLAGKTLQPAVAVTLNNGITAVSGILTAGDNHYAMIGQTVTIGTETPAGYTLGSGITVTPDTVEVADNGDGTYSFTMPAEDVTVSANLNVIDWATESTGDAENPYMIYNKEQLNLLAQRVNSGEEYNGSYFQLGTDITYPHTSDWNDLTSTEDNYTAIGGYHEENRFFCGHFDGDGHTISGIRIYKGDKDHQGLFGWVSEADIHDLTLADARITGGAETGGIVGANSLGTIARCHVASNVAIHANQEWADSHGGIAGQNEGTISHCTSAATLTIADNATNCHYYGAIVGSTYYGSTIVDNLAIGATVPAVTGNFQGAICGNNVGILARNYYYNCNVAGVQNATNVGCDNGDVTELTINDVTYYDGAVSIHTLTLGDNLTTSTDATVTYNETDYYKNGLPITVSVTTPTGYTFNGITVIPATVEVTDNGDGTYSFTMPAEDVTVSANLNLIDWATESTGDAENPYMIYNKEQLNLLAYRVNGTNGETQQSDGYQGKYFKLGADIIYPHTTAWNDATSTESNYEAIGGDIGKSTFFRGHFDGNGHTISGIRIYKDGTAYGDDCQGIFGWVKGADIHDLTLADARITGHQETGGIVGFNEGGSVTRCHVASTVTIHAVTGCSWHGGIAGSNDNYGSVTHCTSAATLTIASGIYCSYYGGICGANSRGTLEDNLAIGATVPAANGNYHGAICGFNDDEVLSRNYYYNCTVAGVQNATNVGCRNADVTELTINDYDNDVTYTYYDGAVYAVIRMVEGYGESTASDHWTFISSPLTDNIEPDNVINLTTTETANYDFYRLNNTIWENIKANTSTNHSDFTALVNGQGYLYANKNDVGLVFKGTYNSESTQAVDLKREWNLVGNPFDAPATVNMSYFRMNATGTAIEPVDITQNTEPIEVCTGIVVKLENTRLYHTITFTRVTTQQSTSNNNGGLQIALSQVVEPVETPARDGNGPSTLRQAQGPALLDNAIVSFNEGSELGKFYFGEQNGNLYIPQGKEEYAIAYSDGHGEMPINFRANENGEYTITVNPENVEMAYLHLIDNMTGADVDLLTTTEYTFNAKVTDYESRFKLVFMANNDGDGASTGSATFAFYSNGSWIIANEGEATLQVIDLNGRILSSETINGSVSKSIHAAPGVYMIRLINGNDVKVQKVVIE